MLSLLLKKQMMEIFRGYFYDAKKNRARSKAGTVAYILLFIGVMAGLLGGIFTYLSLSLCGAMSAFGMDWLYFALMGLLAIFLGIFGSVFNTYSTLYLAKDNDQLLSLPIPMKAIISSRLLSVYLLGLMYSLVVILPAVIVYWVTVSARVETVFGGLLLIFIISVFVLTLSCALGWVVAKISLKLKHKSFITVVVSLAFIFGYYFFYFKAQTMLQDLVANAVLYGEQIKGAAYPLYLFGMTGTGDGFAMAAVTAAVLVLFGIMWVVISRSFLGIATDPGRTVRKAYKETAVKPRSISKALLAKEFGRFTSSPNYMLNCGLCVLLMPIGGGMLLWKGEIMISVLNEVFGAQEGCVPVLLCTMVCMLASMNDMTAPSVSLEGKSLWLAQSLPVTSWQVLRAKLLLQLLLTAIPVLFVMGCLAVVYPCSLPEWLLMTAVAMSFVLLSALFGLAVGLKLPNINWTNEITPIKQSACVMIALFGGFVYTILLFAGFMLMPGWKLGYVAYMSCFTAVTLACCVLLYVWIKRRGCTLFEEL